MKQCCLIIDGFALVYRAYYGLPNTIRNSSGLAVNAVIGFYNTLSSLISQIQPQYLAAVFDHPQPTFRHKLYPPYKANRPPMPVELQEQLPLIAELLAAMEIPILKLPGYEADDVIGTIAANLPYGTEAYIATVDRDTLQLVNDTVTVLIPNRRSNRIYTPDTVEAEIQLPPALIPDLKALMGDASDNIPGISMIGPKTAVKWLKRFGGLELIIANAKLLRGKAGANLRANKSQALLFKNLSTIRINAPIAWCWKHCRLTPDLSPVLPTLAAFGIRAKLPQTFTTTS